MAVVSLLRFARLLWSTREYFGNDIIGNRRVFDSLAFRHLVVASLGTLSSALRSSTRPRDTYGKISFLFIWNGGQRLLTCRQFTHPSSFIRENGHLLFLRRRLTQFRYKEREILSWRNMIQGCCCSFITCGLRTHKKKKIKRMKETKVFELKEEKKNSNRMRVATSSHVCWWPYLFRLSLSFVNVVRLFNSFTKQSLPPIFNSVDVLLLPIWKNSNERHHFFIFFFFGSLKAN